MSSVFLVTTGDYSDYSVLCACRTREDAEKLVERIQDIEGHRCYVVHARVEEYDIVDPDYTPEIMLHRTVCIDYPHIVEEWRYINWPWKTLEEPGWYYDNRNRRLNVYGYDHERVRKVLSDRLAMLRTEPGPQRSSRGSL